MTGYPVKKIKKKGRDILCQIYVRLLADYNVKKSIKKPLHLYVGL